MHSIDPHVRPTPHRLAEDTFLLLDHIGEAEDSLIVHLNSMVIAGQEPVVVDTGSPIHAERHLAQLFSLVEPSDVRWVFVSHDDVDHAGNLDLLMRTCPAATLVTSGLAMVRLVAGGMSIESTRWRAVDDGDFLDVGDRVLVVERPPLYDSPATLGLFDTRTDVYWAADCFGTALTRLEIEAADVPFEEWRRGFVEFQQWNSPWVAGLDGRWWNHLVDRVVERGPDVIASAHGPVLRQPVLTDAVAVLREIPQLAITPHPDRPELDRLLSGARRSA